MLQYALRKVVLSTPVILAVTVLTFLIMHLGPGDPARMIAGIDAQEADVQLIRERLGLNDPLPVQYLRSLWNAVHFDFGKSYRTGRAVSYDVARRFPNTMELALASLFWAVIVGVAVGAFAATRPGSASDVASMGAALVGVSAPQFWLGLLLMLFLAHYAGILPASGRAGPIWSIAGFKSLVMPALALGASAAAVLARMTRSSLLEVMGQDFIRTARAKGLSERVVIYRHALRNAMIPVVTVIGLQLGYLLGGSVIVEEVFAWPGIGTLIVNGVFSRDYPMVQALVMLVAVVFVLLNLLTDLMYAFLDPRIRYS